MSFKDKLQQNKIPQHVAIIMDGNGRWSEKRGMDRIFGHQHGVNAIRDVIEGAVQIGIKYITLYAFSIENWNRPKQEVDSLMSLIVEAIDKETDNLLENNIRLKIIGDFLRLKPEIRDKIRIAIDKLSNSTGLTIIVALSYSSRWEITEAVKNIASKVKNDEINVLEISENTISEHLNTKFIPDPELIIRTSAEKRLSNFLLWQASYSEFAFVDILWPDFTKEDFFETIYEFQNRERRFGKTGKQIFNEE